MGLWQEYVSSRLMFLLGECEWGIYVLTLTRTTISSKSMTHFPGPRVLGLRMVLTEPRAGSPPRKKLQWKSIIFAPKDRLYDDCPAAEVSYSLSGRTSIPLPKSVRRIMFPGGWQVQYGAGVRM